MKIPEGKLPALRVVPMPADSNQNGDIFGGWIMAQVSLSLSHSPFAFFHSFSFGGRWVD